MKTRATLFFGLITLFALSCLTGCGDKIVRPLESAVPSAAEASYPVELTQADLAAFENNLNSEANYGFLLSAYADVRDVDMYQVFYIGAGMQPPANADEIRAASLATFTDGTPDCDCTILTSQQISSFLLSKTGYTLAEMSSSLSWSYIADYDAYVHWHGDTNKVNVSCTGGRQITADTYEIEFEAPGGIYNETGDNYSGGTVNLRVADGSMQFISNSLR